MAQARGTSAALWIGGLLWGSGAALVFVALWPAMWVRPLETLQIVAGQMGGYIVEGHSLPSYFMGRIVDDPGPMFYPLALVMRLSAMTTIGLFVAAWIVARRHRPYESARARGSVLGNLLFSVILVLLMAVASKKLDRYILPATLTLDLIAVGGWLGAVAVFTGWNSDRDQAGPVR